MIVLSEAKGVRKALIGARIPFSICIASILYVYGVMDLAPLVNAPALKRLRMKPAALGDLTPLYTLPALNYLEINNHYFAITDYVEQIEALHDAMPGLEIVLSGNY